MKRYALLALLICTPVHAEDAPPSPFPPQAITTPPPQMFYFEVDANDVQAVGTALNFLPKNVADPLIMKLNKQLGVQAQIIASRTKALDAPSQSTLTAQDKSDAEPSRRHRR